MSDTITEIPLDDLHESPFNPRRSYSAIADAEQAADIKSHGRILQPLLVRPRVPPMFAGDPDALVGYEIVFGHRRARNGRTAGLVTAPCMVRAMSDDEVRRAQISENLQRKDVHPIEEAEGFQALIDNDRMTADTIAEQFGKSRSYVYGRLKLLAACPTIRNACLAGEIGSEVALLIARLRTGKLQEKALGYIKGKYIEMGDGGAKSFRQIRDLLNERFTLKLKGSAIFDIYDETLLPLAGNCHVCPKRSENAPEYADLVDGDKPGPYSHRTYGPNVCTDPDCFDAKKRAHLKREADKLEATGKAVVAGSAARQAIDASGHIKGAYVALKDVEAELKKLPRKGIEGDANQPTIVTIQDPRDGKTYKAVKRADLAAAGVKVKEASSTGRDDAVHRAAAAATRAKQEADTKAENKVRAAIFDRVRKAAASAERSAFDLAMVAMTTFEGVAWQDKEPLAELYGFKSEHALEQRIGQMSVAELTLFVIDCALIANVRVLNHYQIAEKPDALLKAAKHYGIDVDQVRAELATEAGTGTTPALAARAQDKAAAGAKKSRAKAAPARSKASTLESLVKDRNDLETALRADEQKDNAGVAGGDGAQADLLSEASS